MITINDQEELFRLIAKNLQQDVACWAFGGTALMYLGLKEETKDIDLLFETAEERALFIEALERLGFQETSPIKIYVPEKLREQHRPVMYQRGETRFDLFETKVFRTRLSPAMQEGTGAVHEYRQGLTLTIKVIRPEHITYLKGITDRANDLKDIKTILDKEKDFDWDVLVDEAVWQHQHGDSWALLDTEKTLNELKEEHFIEEKQLKRLYDA